MKLCCRELPVLPLTHGDPVRTGGVKNALSESMNQLQSWHFRMNLTRWTVWWEIG